MLLMLIELVKCNYSYNFCPHYRHCENPYVDSDVQEKSTTGLLSKGFDQPSGPEHKAKDLVEGILSAPEIMSKIYDPLTSSVKSDSDLDTSVLDVSAASDETTPTDITSRRVQMAGRQECAWPVHTPPSRDKQSRGIFLCSIAMI